MGSVMNKALRFLPSGDLLGEEGGGGCCSMVSMSKACDSSWALCFGDVGILSSGKDVKARGLPAFGSRAQVIQHDTMKKGYAEGREGQRVKDND